MKPSAWKVDRYGETTAPISPDLLREIPPAERARITVKPIFKGAIPVGIRIDGSIPW